MTTDINGMSVRQYLAQGSVYIDGRTGHVFEVSQMSRDRREDAARELVRTATALISLAEAEASRQMELRTALQLVRQPPRVWITRTELYRALYPAPAVDVPAGAGNQDRDLRVITSYDVPRSA